MSQEMSQKTTPGLAAMGLNKPEDVGRYVELRRRVGKKFRIVKSELWPEHIGKIGTLRDCRAPRALEFEPDDQTLPMRISVGINDIEEVEKPR